LAEIPSESRCGEWIVAWTSVNGSFSKLIHPPEIDVPRHYLRKSLSFAVRPHGFFYVRVVYPKGGMRFACHFVGNLL
ncbi:MAG: hypothetical protein ACI4U2_02230, partial [Christensenellaceae bacterium]